MKKCFLLFILLIPILLSGCWENRCSKNLHKLISDSLLHCPIDNEYYWNTSFYEKIQIMNVCNKPLFDAINNKNYSCNEAKLIEKYKQCLDIVDATKFDTADYYVWQSECVTNILNWFTESIKNSISTNKPEDNETVNQEIDNNENCRQKLSDAIFNYSDCLGDNNVGEIEDDMVAFDTFTNCADSMTAIYFQNTWCDCIERDIIKNYVNCFSNIDIDGAIKSSDIMVPLINCSSDVFNTYSSYLN